MNSVLTAVMSLIGSINISKPPIATPGDASYLNVTRSLTDVYNLLFLIFMLLLFWVMWNVIRTLYRILCDFKKY